MHIILLGAPGAGKGTQAEYIKSHYNLIHLSTGDLLRAAVRSGSGIGRLAKSYMDAGTLIPDAVIIDVIRDYMGGLGDVDLLFDGFPRTVAQAEGLAGLLDGSTVKAVFLTVPDEVVIERLSSRRTCRDCGKVFNIRMGNIPPNGICDQCGGEIYQRDDDRAETIANRIKVFHSQTEPILNYYRSRNALIEIDGMGQPTEVFMRIRKALD